MKDRVQPASNPAARERAFVGGLLAGMALLVASCSGANTLSSSHAASPVRVAQSPPSPGTPTTDNQLAAVACRTPSDCIAVGHLAEGIDAVGPDTRTLLLENNGSGWSVVASPNAPGRVGSAFRGVTCVAPRKCIAVGTSENAGSNPLTLIEEDDGSGWTIVPSPNASDFGGVGVLNAVACATPAYCVAVGQYEAENGYSQTLIEEDSGQGWTLMSSPNSSASNDEELDAVACASRTFCVAAGFVGLPGETQQPLIETNAGAGWEISPVPGVGALHGVACPAVGSCVATGGEFSISSNTIIEQPLIEELSAGRWTAVATPNVIGTLGEVACPSANYCISIGTSAVAQLGANVSAVVVAERTGSIWTVGGAPYFGKDVVSFNAVACATPGKCIGVGERLVSGRYPEPRATLIAEHTNRVWAVDETPNA
jgi:hypothetical protein